MIFSHKSTTGFDGTSWFIWRVQVREQPPDYKTYYIPRGSNFALTVPSQGQWYTFSTPTGGPISSSQDFVVKERGSMFIVINFRDELSGIKQLWFTRFNASVYFSARVCWFAFILDTTICLETFTKTTNFMFILYLKPYICNITGYYKFVSTDQKESYILLEAIVSMVSSVEVYGLRGSTVTLQPQTGGITLWIKTLSVSTAYSFLK